MIMSSVYTLNYCEGCTDVCAEGRHVAYLVSRRQVHFGQRVKKFLQRHKLIMVHSFIDLKMKQTNKTKQNKQTVNDQIQRESEMISPFRGTVSFEYFLWDGLGLFTEIKRKAHISFLIAAT